MNRSLKIIMVSNYFIKQVRQHFVAFNGAQYNIPVYEEKCITADSCRFNNIVCSLTLSRFLSLAFG
jgi:hypothetical protein